MLHEYTIRVSYILLHFLLLFAVPHLTRQDIAAMHDCIAPEKVLAVGLYRLAHGPAMNAGKSTVVEAVQQVVNALFDARNHCIKFPRTAAETAACIQTFVNM